MSLAAFKKLGLTAAFFSSLIGANAQSDSKDVTLNVELQNACSIVFGAGSNGQTATLSYTTPAHYLNGVSLSQAAAFTASSTQAYVIKVKSDGDLVYGSGGTPVGNTDPIPIGNVTIQASATGTTGIVFENAVALSGTDKVVLTADAGTVSQVFGLVYSTEGSEKSDFINKAEGTYTSTLTYTITAP